MRKFYLDCSLQGNLTVNSRMKTSSVSRTTLPFTRSLQLLKKVASPLPIRQRERTKESYSLSNSKRLASKNCPSRFENIIHRTNCFAPLAVPTSFK